MQYIVYTVNKSLIFNQVFLRNRANASDFVEKLSDVK